MDGVIAFLSGAETVTWPSAPSAKNARQGSEKEKSRPATALASVGCRPDFLLASPGFSGPVLFDATQKNGPGAHH